MSTYRGLADEIELASVQMGFRISIDDRRVLANLARERNISMSSLLREIVSDYIKSHVKGMRDGGRV